MLSKIFKLKSTSKQTLKVTMLGHSGVGKTSLLCAMYEQFDQIIGKTNLQLTPDDETKTILDQRLKQLKESAQQNSIKIRGGLDQTTTPRTYNFDLGKTGSSPSIELKFQDYKGEDFLNPEKRKNIEQFITESVAILIPIDCPALMENNSQWHEEFNQPKIIYDLFKSSFENLTSPKLVIFAPVKCEKYLRESNDEQKLITAVQEKYSNLLSFFRSDALVPYVAAVMTPVETLGSVDFSRIEEDENRQPIFYFRKPDPNRFYEPRNSDQPLRYLFRFLLKLHLQHRKMSFLESIFMLMDKDKTFINSIGEFSNGCKNNGAFTVFQGANLLNIN
jgi:GTPase SAR1 family protein